MTKILILGGTKEASQLAAQLLADGHKVTTSLAGRTKEPKPVAGEVRIGGFGGAKGLADYLIENGIEKLIDATHPFAKQISENAKQAASSAKVAFETHTRPPWKKRPDDNWIEVTSLEAARDYIPSEARVLLALGSQHIDLFKTRDDVFFLVRMVDQPATPLSLPDCELLISKPSLDWANEADMLKVREITHIVCRNSGGDGAYAKIVAARELKLEVVMIKR
ncbi:MAG: cobalt-precorrin-6A reductase [Pseudomonadota bacterium]